MKHVFKEVPEKLYSRGYLRTTSQVTCVDECSDDMVAYFKRFGVANNISVKDNTKIIGTKISASDWAIEDLK